MGEAARYAERDVSVVVRDRERRGVDRSATTMRRYRNYSREGKGGVFVSLTL